MTGSPFAVDLPSFNLLFKSHTKLAVIGSILVDIYYGASYELALSQILQLAKVNCNNLNQPPIPPNLWGFFEAGGTPSGSSGQAG